MMRGNFSYNVNKQHNTSSAACVDPTNTVPGQSADTGNPATAYTGESCADGTFVRHALDGERREGQRLLELQVAVQRERDVSAPVELQRRGERLRPPGVPDHPVLPSAGK
jgi:hypothetical protein